MSLFVVLRLRTAPITASITVAQSLERSACATLIWLYAKDFSAGFQADYSLANKYKITSTQQQSVLR